PYGVGTKAAARYHFRLAPGETVSVRLRLADAVRPAPFGPDFDRVLAERPREADDLYAALIPPQPSDDAQGAMRQACAGLLWSKQFYHYDVARWADGDPGFPSPAPDRAGGRNGEWRHLYNEDVISMPDKWEYPWYAAWDLAFHTVALALVDPEFA